MDLMERKNPLSELDIRNMQEGLEEFETEVLQLVSFKLAGEEYAVDVMTVQEINRLADVTRVPKAPGFVDGVVNLRGKILPVINLRRFLGFPPTTEITEEMRTIVVNAEGVLAGLTVDAVNQVIRIPAKRVEKNQDFGSARNLGDVIQGVVHLEDRLVILLDIFRLLNTKSSEKERPGF